ncbi:MAG: phosphoribosylanthranilate isomerase [Sphingomonadales bacterium]|nr:phosphoribosylanthranilate isomerase [Sphingomonadales bacterium]
MPAPLIKICGISTADTLGAVIAARADHIGLMFVGKSPRHVTLDQAAALGRQASGRIGIVGVFMDASDAEVAAATEAAGLDALQLHGSESPERAAQLRARHGLPVWKVLSVASRADLDRAAAYAQAADLVLLDAKTPKGALPGGLGLTFDWSLLAGWKAPLPWGLAGGLSPANVAEAVRISSAPLVDVSSGVESAPGIKDPALIAAFGKAARGA